MALPTIPGVVRAAVKGTMPNGQTWVNVQHFEYALGASSPGTTEIDGLHIELARFYVGTNYTTGKYVLFYGPNTLKTLQVDYTVLDAASLMYTKLMAASGTSAATGVQPSELAPVLTLRTAVRGRRNRGRIYLPTPTTNGYIGTTGDLDTVYTGAIVLQYMDMRTALAAKQWRPVVASYGKSLINDPVDKHDKIEVTWTPYATPITNVTMDTKVDVQRSRK
jgi:hypothetical protein